MKYKRLLIFFLIVASTAVRADAADSRYRVEILVLTHLEHDQAPRETAVLNDFSAALDFLTPPPATDTEASADGDVTVATGAVEAPADDTLAALEGAPGDEPEAEEECAVVHLTEMGPEMQDAWRRLRLSRPFRPLQYLAWEQPGVAPFPELRVHDLEPVFTDDPWRHLREPVVVAEDPEDPAGASSAGLFSSKETGDATPGLFSTDEADDEGSDAGPLPSPIQYFQLDGKAQLVRTRFLHLALEVEWREPVFDPSSIPVQAVPPDNAGDLQDQDGEPQPTSFLIQRLAQRRQVKTGRMEYFDGPVLGVLAFITDISDTAADETSEP
jgi:hypothetical protein